MEPPAIRYVNCDGREVAYQMLGSGAVPFVGYFEIGAHLDLTWTDPLWAQQAERFSGIWRAVFFQMRGIGLSEPVDRRPTLEEQASDIAVVMDAAGLRRALGFAIYATAPGAVAFAASHPDRVDGLVLVCPYLSMPLAGDRVAPQLSPGRHPRADCRRSPCRPRVRGGRDADRRVAHRRSGAVSRAGSAYADQPVA